MTLAILEAGAPPEPLDAAFGRYPAMFERLLGLEATRYDVAAGALPPDVGRHEAYLITGSPAGVYEGLHWIPRLSAFLRAAKGRSKLIGICFGHQIMAEAFGGHVEKSAKGWGVGLHTYPIVKREPWMDEAPAVSVPASHQDQVELQPPNTDVIASSVFTPYAGLAWRDGSAISFQFHPEFSPAYARALGRGAARRAARSRQGDRLAGRAQRQCAGRRVDQAVPGTVTALVRRQPLPSRSPDWILIRRSSYKNLVVDATPAMPLPLPVTRKARAVVAVAKQYRKANPPAAGSSP